ncbi:MAG TPA: FAD-dependent oxidoreductase [Phycisphaerae bacterium]|nr:FAD-dependent oxidoreductase [Phycisphaerae bacterium]
MTIDSRQVEVPEGATVLEAARKLGIDIPTMCFMEGLAPSTSCMVCVVKWVGQDRLVPACAAPAVDGMVIESESDEVRQARQAALEILLSDHLGDCEAPCQSACPAHMNIPLMIRQIARGRMPQAIATVKADIALPAVLGRICPAPCEKACRRGARDAPVGICLLKRYAADADLVAGRPHSPACRPPSGRKVAIVGAGPTGLAAAYYLHQAGHACTVFDDHDQPGGMLRYGVDEARLPRDVLDAEIATIAGLGAEMRVAARVGPDELDHLRREYDAVVVAVGRLDQQEDLARALDAAGAGVEADRRTFQTAHEGVFAAGDAAARQRLAVRAAADGKGIAASVDQYLAGRPVTGLRRPFSVHVGRLLDGEIDRFMEGADPAARTCPPVGEDRDSAAALPSLGDAQARIEAARCMHCDCRKPDACKLRIYAEAYHAHPGRYRTARRRFEQQRDHPRVVYEPGKCIDCGLCIKIAERHREPLGLTFIGRGFDVRVAVPFGRSLAEGLSRAAADCVAACPTGALAFAED